jgi:hypothetical protein
MREFKDCEQAVGKVVISLVQLRGLCKLSGHILANVVNYVFTVRRLLARSNQALLGCTHAVEALSLVLGLTFYTFSTGPNTTNKLNKGLSR